MEKIIAGIEADLKVKKKCLAQGLEENKRKGKEISKKVEDISFLCGDIASQFVDGFSSMNDQVTHLHLGVDT